MKASFAGTAAAGLVSAIALSLLPPGMLTYAQNTGVVRHADLEDALAEESAPPAELGPAAPLPPRSARPSTARSKSSLARGMNTKDRSISQTAGLMGRSAGPTAARPPALPATPPASSSSSSIQQELEAIYRKNGREMPDMNLDEYQAQPTIAPNVPANRNVPGNVSAPAGQNAAASPQMNGNFRPVPRASKPNFFERMFHVGRAREPQVPAAQRPQQLQPQAKKPEGPVQSWPMPSAARSQPVPSGMPYGPYANPGAAQPAPAVATPQPATRGMLEPAPLAPAEEMDFPRRGAATTPRIRGRDTKPLLDESNARDDDESLDLTDDQPATAAPKVQANQPPERRDASPYTGLKITPNESEHSIARPSASDLSLSVEQPAEKTAAPEEPSTTTFTLETSSPAPSAAAQAKSRLDDELPDLDREEREQQQKSVVAEKEKSVPAEKQQPIAEEKSASAPVEKIVPEPFVRRAREALPDSAVAPVEKPAPEPIAKTPAPEAAPKADRFYEEPEGPKLLKGFNGYCPVMLKDERRLVVAKAAYVAEYRGRTYTFSSAAAKFAFEENPRKYVPAGSGNDVVRLASGEENVPGTLDFAAWYRGRLYLFSSPETRKSFVETPSQYLVND